MATDLQETRFAHLYPTAKGLFQNRRVDAGLHPVLRWLMILAAAGTMVMAGRWLLDRMDRSL